MMKAINSNQKFHLKKAMEARTPLAGWPVKPVKGKGVPWVPTHDACLFGEEFCFFFKKWVIACINASIF